MSLSPDGPAPYAPPATVVALMSGYRERGYATPFTAEVLVRAGVPDSLTHRVLHTLRLLGLIDDDGAPTPQFETLKRTRGDEEYKAELKAWLYDVYSDVLQYADPITDDVGRVTEAFRGYKPEGQRPRMVTLMLGLFEYADLIQAQRRESPAPRRQTTPKQRVAKTVSTNSASHVQMGAPTPQNVSAAPAPTGIPPELVGLLQSIPADRQWTHARRESFIRAFTTVLDYSIALVADAKPAAAEEADE